MHLKFGYFVLYIPIYPITERKNVSMYKTVHAYSCENRLCAQTPRARQGN